MTDFSKYLMKIDKKAYIDRLVKNEEYKASQCLKKIKEASDKLVKK